MSRIWLGLRILVLVVLVFIFFVWGWKNEQMVTWNIMILSEPAELRMSRVMGIMLFIGFIFGILTAFYVMSRLKLANALRQRRKDKEQQKRLQNEALAKSADKVESEMPTTEQ